MVPEIIRNANCCVSALRSKDKQPVHCIFGCFKSKSYEPWKERSVICRRYSVVVLITVPLPRREPVTDATRLSGVLEDEG